MVEVKLNKSNNNPFYGLRNCLKLFQSAGGTITESMLNSAWDEVKGDKVKRELFFSLLFSVGDITARQHNIFKGVKKDTGGNANREGFYTIFCWLKDNHKEQFIKFLNAGLFNEYQCFDTLFRSRVQTKGARVLKVYDIFADKWYRAELVKYVYAVINGSNPFNKLLVAKFLTIPRLSKRAGHKQMLPQTKQVMENKTAFLIELSKLMGWEYSVKGAYANFAGYRAWRRQYNGSLESVLFSTGKIAEFDKTQFIDWLDKLPSQARFRVKNRVLYSKVAGIDIETAGLSQKAVAGVAETLKWPKLSEWFKEWEEYKTKKQAEQRVLEEKVRQGQATTEDVEKLEKVKKQAKVNVGATSFNELYDQIMQGRVDELKLEAFIQNKVNLPYNSLVIIDDSIVRGTTLRESIFKILDRLHPKKIVMVSSSPQIRYPDYYGIDMSHLEELCAFRAAIALIHERGMHEIISETYRKCKEQIRALSPEEQGEESPVREIYAPFTVEEINKKIVEMLRPNDMHAPVELVFQSIEGLHEACPNHPGDWYFTGHYPTPGGIRKVNQAFVSYVESPMFKKQITLF